LKFITADLLANDIEIDEQLCDEFEEASDQPQFVDRVHKSKRGRSITAQAKEVHRGKRSL
jgi:hypothetical protein